MLVEALLGVPLLLGLYIVGAELLVGRLPVRLQRTVRAWAWLTPALAIAGVVFVYPVLDTIWISFLDGTQGPFVGLRNYANVLGDPGVILAIRNNVLWLVLFTSAVLVLGTLFAVLTDRVRYETIAKSAVFMPMAISFVAASVIWTYMYQYQPPGAVQTGTLDAFVAGALHLQPLAWLVDRSINNLALIAIGTWVWTGYAMVIVSAALKGIPPELHEAARIDGASELQVFARVTLPLLAPTLILLTTTLAIYTVRAFDIVYVTTSGNFDTDVIANRMYKTLFINSDPAGAAALAVLMLVVMFPVIYLNGRRVRREALNI